jgi:hypothetical protein
MRSERNFKCKKNLEFLTTQKNITRAISKPKKVYTHHTAVCGGRRAR